MIRNIIIILSLITICMGSFGQSRAIVDFEADLMKPAKVGDSTVLSLVGNVVFHHNGTIITCDSAIRYSDRLMECYNNVIVNKDSTFIYGERADYNGITNVANVYSLLVKLVDKDVTMYSYDLNFNTLTNVGQYNNSGTISQKDNLMESRKASYHTSKREIFFEEMVSMKNDDYSIKTDSMGYNFDTEVTTFYKNAQIWNKEGDFLSANRGKYIRPQDTYVFTKNSYILTADQQMWADSITYIKGEELSYMYKDIQLQDEKQRVISFGDYGVYRRNEGEAMMTLNPSIAGYEEREGSDTVFMRADSIFVFTLPIDSTTFAIDSTIIVEDSTLTNASKTADLKEVEGQPAEINDHDHDHDHEAIPPKKTKRESKREKRAREELERQQKEISQITDTTELTITEGDSIPALTDILVESVKIAQTIADSTKIEADTTKIADLKKIGEQKPAEADTMQRIIKGFYNVKIFRTDFQAVCDSIVSYSIDSTVHMYNNPVLWNENNQIVADEIHGYTRNQQLYKADFEGSPMMIQDIDGISYNQVAGKIMYAFFRNNDIYQLDVDGNAQTYYYLQDEKTQDITGFLVAESSDITFKFDSSRVDQITYRGTPVYTIYPMDKIPATQEKTLKGFEWKGNIRPKTKAEVFNRQVRPSQREESMMIPKPDFGITTTIGHYKQNLLRNNMWRDRNDKPWIKASYFKQLSQ